MIQDSQIVRACQVFQIYEVLFEFQIFQTYQVIHTRDQRPKKCSRAQSSIRIHEIQNAKKRPKYERT